MGVYLACNDLVTNMVNVFVNLFVDDSYFDERLDLFPKDGEFESLTNLVPQSL